MNVVGAAGRFLAVSNGHEADDLRAALSDLEQLRGGTMSTFNADSLEELSTVLVKARIARGWTHGSCLRL